MTQHIERFKEQLVTILRRGATLRVFDYNWQPVQVFIADWSVRLYRDDPANGKWLLRFRPVGLWQQGGDLHWHPARYFEVDALAQIEEMAGVPAERRTAGLSPNTPESPEGGLRVFGSAAFGYHILVLPGTGDYDWQAWVAARAAHLEARPDVLARWEALEA